MPKTTKYKILLGSVLSIPMFLLTLFIVNNSHVLADSHVNAIVCSGGKHTPSIVNTTPASGTTTHSGVVTLSINANWVDAITVKSGPSIIYTSSGANKNSEIFSTGVTLSEGVNNFNIEINGGCPTSTITDTLKITYTKNNATVNNTIASNASPSLHGAYSPGSVDVYVVIDGKTYQAQTDATNLTWTIPTNTISPGLNDGTYDIRVYTKDANSNIVYDHTYKDALTIDTTPPKGSIESSATSKNRSPNIYGNIDDPDATIDVTINGKTYKATNNGDGTWSLDSGDIEDLSNGSYEIVVKMTDKAGNTTTLSKKLKISASGQTGFILPPDTGYIRVGSTNIYTKYIYIAVSLIVIILAIGYFARKRLKRANS